MTVENYTKNALRAAFTLVELSIVLVIIGLLTGGIMVGQHLILQASVDAQIAQLDQFNRAANTFSGKYGSLPGDLDPLSATQFGFISRSGAAGQGDGNGLIEGYAGTPSTAAVFGGEDELFWCDLSSAQLIPYSFSNSANFGTTNIVSATQIVNYLPPAKIGGNNYIYVMGTAANNFTNISTALNRINYFGIEVISGSTTDGGGRAIGANRSFSVYIANAIDSKIDDGFPTTGNVLAVYLNSEAFDPNPNVGPATSSSCYDSNTLLYNTSYQSNINCSLVVKTQF